MHHSFPLRSPGVLLSETGTSLAPPPAPWTLSFPLRCCLPPPPALLTPWGSLNPSSPFGLGWDATRGLDPAGWVVTGGLGDIPWSTGQQLTTVGTGRGKKLRRCSRTTATTGVRGHFLPPVGNSEVSSSTQPVPSWPSQGPHLQNCLPGLPPGPSRAAGAGEAPLCSASLPPLPRLCPSSLSPPGLAPAWHPAPPATHWRAAWLLWVPFPWRANGFFPKITFLPKSLLCHNYTPAKQAALSLLVEIIGE